MTREEAIQILKAIRVYECYPKSASEETKEAIDMAIEALSAEPIYCNECKHQDYCYQTVSYTKVRLGYKEHGAKPIEWCSKAERREP